MYVVEIMERIFNFPMSNVASQMNNSEELSVSRLCLLKLEITYSFRSIFDLRANSAQGDWPSQRQQRREMLIVKDSVDIYLHITSR